MSRAGSGAAFGSGVECTVKQTLSDTIGCSTFGRLWPGVWPVFLVIWLVTGLLGPAAYGQDGDEGGEVPEPVEVQEAEGEPVEEEFDRSIEGINRAARLFDQVVQTYRRNVIRDACTVTMKRVPGGEEEAGQSFDVPLVMSREGVRIELNDIVFTAVDGTVYGESAEVPERLFAMDYEGELTTSMFVGQLAIFPFPQFGLCLSDQPLEEVFFFTFDARVAGHRTVTSEGEEQFEEIRIESSTDGAPCVLRIDPATHLVVEFRAMLRNPDDPESGMDVITRMEPEVLDEFPHGEFVVDMEGRRVVDSVGGLFAPPNTVDLIGAMCPAFEFEGFGETEGVTTDTGFGRVRVISFWSFGSESMVGVIDALVELDAWVEEEGLACDVIPVWCDVSVDDLEFWMKNRAVSMPMWMDRGAGSAIEDFQVPLLPTTVIVGPDGIIHRAWSDSQAPENMVGRLKAGVRSALEKGL